MPDHFDHCADLVRQSDRDRYLATLLAPAQHRPALFALYAFNVEITQVRDKAREPLPGEIRLQWWREVLGGERPGEGEANPVSAALLASLKQYGFVAAPLLELIDAHGFDLYGEPMPTIGELELYGIQTESPLTAMACAVLAEGTALPETFTLDLSVATALTNVLVGLPRHAAQRRLYLPLDVLDRHQVDREDIFAGQATPALRAALTELRQVTRAHLAKARTMLEGVPRKILPALLPLALIEPTLRLMDRSDYEPFSFRPLPPWRRQWLMWRASRKGAI